MTIASGPLIAVTGLRAEARVIRRPGIIVICGGGNPAMLARSLATALEDGASGVVSIGIAGGLAAGLSPGTVVVGDAAIDADERYPCAAPWHEALLWHIKGAIAGSIAGIDQPAVDHAAKRGLHLKTGAVAVDMESHVAARLAAQRGVPFAALRVIADPAERALPPAALVGMRPDGRTDIAAVLRSLARDPVQLPGLIRVALDVRAAFRSLRRAADALPRLPH